MIYFQGHTEDLIEWVPLWAGSGNGLHESREKQKGNSLSEAVYHKPKRE